MKGIIRVVGAEMDGSGPSTRVLRRLLVLAGVMLVVYGPTVQTAVSLPKHIPSEEYPVETAPTISLNWRLVVCIESLLNSLFSFDAVEVC